MGNQDSNFFSGGSSFGITQTATLANDELTDLIFAGNDPSTKPSDITKIESEDEDKKDTVLTEDKVEVTADDIFADDEETEDPVLPSKKKEEPNKEEVTEVEDEGVFTTLSKNLIDLGIFSQGEDEALPTTAEEFKDKWFAERQAQVNDGIYNFLMSKHGDEGVKLFDDIFVNGVDPREYLAKYTEIQSFKDLDISIESNQERVVRESLRRQGLKDEIIDKKIQKLKDYGDLEEEAGIAHELVVNQDEEQLEAMAEQKAKEEEFKRHQKAQNQNNLQKILSDKLKARDFDGIPVTEKVVREVYDYMDTEKWQLKNGEKLTEFDKDLLELRDPKNIELKLKLALLLKNKLDLTKLKTSLVSKETNKYFNDIVIKDKVIKKSIPTPSTGGSFFDSLSK